MNHPPLHVLLNTPITDREWSLAMSGVRHYAFVWRGGRTNLAMSLALKAHLFKARKRARSEFVFVCRRSTLPSWRAASFEISSARSVTAYVCNGSPSRPTRSCGSVNRSRCKWRRLPSLAARRDTVQTKLYDYHGTRYFSNNKKFNRREVRMRENSRPAVCRRQTAPLPSKTSTTMDGHSITSVQI